MTDRFPELPDTSTEPERAAYDRYKKTVLDLDGIPMLSFTESRRLISAYSAWVRLFCPMYAHSLIADFRRLIVIHEHQSGSGP